MPGLPLTPDELACVTHVMGRIGCREDVVAAGPQALVDDWLAFVVRSEAGFACARVTFLQDLSARTLLARLFLRLPPPLATKLERTVAEADFRYRSLTKRSAECVLPGRLAARHDPARDFWLFGVPETVRFSE